MADLIRIGDLILNLSNLCYARDGEADQLHLLTIGGELTLDGNDAAYMRNRLRRASTRVGTSPQLPEMTGKGQFGATCD